MHLFWAVLTFTEKLAMMMTITIRRTIKSMMWLNHQNLHQILTFPHQVPNFLLTNLLMDLLNKILLIVGKKFKQKMSVETVQYLLITY